MAKISKNRLKKSLPIAEEINRYYCFNCGQIFEIREDTGISKKCVNCGGRLGKIIAQRSYSAQRN